MPVCISGIYVGSEAGLYTITFPHSSSSLDLPRDILLTCASIILWSTPTLSFSGFIASFNLVSEPLNFLVCTRSYTEFKGISLNLTEITPNHVGHHIYARESVGNRWHLSQQVVWCLFWARIRCCRSINMQIWAFLHHFILDALPLWNLTKSETKT